ncbi:MAG TPA: iron-containing alcohol dehydrogenase [Acidimicrobiales bacterium]|nr:iron-containing alcohol dehydrogenase [Acidimicrobiales bacterium]
MRVAFIGLGHMGGPMSRNLAQAGVDLTVYDLNRNAAVPAVSHGARLADSAAEAVRQADVVITMLPTPGVVESVMLDPGGVLAAMPERSLWVDMSTSVPAVAERVRGRIGSRGIRVLDAPVSGMSKGAAAGTLQIFVGGDPADLAEVRPLLNIMGDPDQVLHVGGPGAGYVTKLMINLLWFTQLVGIAEVLTVGVRAGVDLPVLHRSLVASPANSVLLQKDVLSLLHDGDYDEGFVLALACKDLALALDLAREVQVPVELSALVGQIYQRARASFGDLAGEMSPVKLYEQIAGIELRMPAEPGDTRARAVTPVWKSDQEEQSTPASSRRLTDVRVDLGPFPPAKFAVGAISELPALVRRFGYERVLVVTDTGLRGSRMLQSVTDLLAHAGLATAVFAEVHPNPTTHDLEAGSRMACDLGPDIVLLALGGGSALDAAKGIALAATNRRSGRDLTWSENFVSALPIVAVPTTSGTGAECNDFGVVTDPDTHRKFYVGSPTCLARSVILDPELTLTLPPGPTAASGVDCLTHALESYLSIRANPWADGLDLHVVRLVSRYLRRAVRDGRDLEARSNLLLAAHMAGQAMRTTGLGIIHGIGHPLGGRHDVPHGVALSLVLAECLRFNEPACMGRLAKLAEPLAVHSSSGSVARNAGAAIAAAEQLLNDVSMPSSLQDFSITVEDLPAIAEDALADPVMANTPRPPSAADIQQILSAAL